MANVFAILTSIVLLVAGFVAYKNQAAYQIEIDNRKARQEELTANQTRLKIAREELAATIAERTDVDAQVVALQDQESAQKGTNADLEAQKRDKTTQTGSNKEKLDVIRAKTEKIGDLNQLASKMRTTKAELEELSVNIKSAEDKLNNLTTTNTETEAQVTAMKKKFETISNGQSLPILHTRIRSIYPTWGFVTLGTGNSGGVVANSTLDVVRDGSTIAKLLVTAVERNSASASIIPDSIAQDVVLMVGDQVIPTQGAAKN